MLMNVPNHHQCVINMQNVQIQSDLILVNVTRDSSEMAYRIVQVLKTVLDNFFEARSLQRTLFFLNEESTYKKKTICETLCILPDEDNNYIAMFFHYPTINFILKVLFNK